MSHALVLVLIVAMFNLGLWQLRRLDDKRDRNDRITARLDEPVDDLAALTEGLDLESAVSVEYRLAVATGTYLTDEQVLVRNRTLSGAPGYWVLTPLELPGGRAVVVNRGWVPVALVDAGDLADADPPPGEVQVGGLVLDSEVRQGLQSGDPDEGVLAEMARVDLARLQQQIDLELLPVQLQLEGQDPAQAASTNGLPVMLDRPTLDEGPHLGYAVQWFVFTSIALVGYPLILRRVARDRAREAGSPDTIEDPGPSS